MRLKKQLHILTSLVQLSITVKTYLKVCFFLIKWVCQVKCVNSLKIKIETQFDNESSCDNL